MATTAKEILEDIGELRGKIETSKNLAKDVENFCDGIAESLKNGLTMEGTLLEVIDFLLDDEPDVTLRTKLRSLLEVWDSCDGLDRHRISLRL